MSEFKAWRKVQRVPIDFFWPLETVWDKAKELPAGDGWQMWATMPTLTPLSPVFKASQELASYCEAHISVFNKLMTSYEIWSAFILGKQDLTITLVPRN